MGCTLLHIGNYTYLIMLVGEVEGSIPGGCCIGVSLLQPTVALFLSQQYRNASQHQPTMKPHEHLTSPLNSPASHCANHHLHKL